MGNYLQYALGKIIGTKNERELKRLSARVGEMNALEAEMQQLPDAEFALRTARLKERLAQGESLDNLLPEAFALCREAGRRVLNMRHFDVQLIGGMVLHESSSKARTARFASRASTRSSSGPAARSWTPGNACPSKKRNSCRKRSARRR